MKHDLVELVSGSRRYPDQDFPIRFKVTYETTGDDGMTFVEEGMSYLYNPDDPYGDLNPQIAAWLLSHPDFEIGPYEAPPPPVPADFTLTKRQINAALILSGQTDPNGFIEGIVAAIADPVQKALALNDWQNAPLYQRDHQLFNDPNLLAAAGMTSGDIDALWMAAKDLPA